MRDSYIWSESLEKSGLKGSGFWPQTHTTRRPMLWTTSHLKDWYRRATFWVASSSTRSSWIQSCKDRRRIDTMLVSNTNQHKIAATFFISHAAHKKWCTHNRKQHKLLEKFLGIISIEVPKISCRQKRRHTYWVSTAMHTLNVTALWITDMSMSAFSTRQSRHLRIAVWCNAFSKATEYDDKED